MPRIERIKKRHLLKKKEQKQEIDSIEADLGTAVKALDAKNQLESGILDDGSRVLLLDGKILFFEHEKRMFPTLRSVLENIISLPQVTVDMGAVKYVVNGADIMRPGITHVNEGIRAGSIVAVVDERHGKPLAIGVSTLSTEDLRATDTGKVILSVHYINDPLWEFGKT
jgi:PUA-domain protein